MSQLVNKSFLNSVFVQDAINDFIKIDNVIVGETPEFGYDTKINDDIGQLLQNCLNDGNIVAILYNWNDKIAYTKRGFNLSVSSDSKQVAGFTTFIVKNRISQNNLNYFNTFVAPVQTPIQTPIIYDPTKPRVNEFVRINGTSIELNGRSFPPVGWNAFFMGLVQETMAYPSHAQITEVFEAARKMKATVIRSHTLGFSAENTMTLLNKDNKFNDAAWDIIDFAYTEAKRCSIKLIIVLCDPYEYYHGSLKTFCVPFGIPKDQFFTHPTPRAEFKKYITNYVNHINKYSKKAIKDSIEVAFFELGNELGNIRPDAGSTAIPTRDWIQDITSHLKSVAPNHLILNGSDECLGGPISQDFSVENIDCYSSHFYWQDWNRIKRDAANSQNVNRPYIIGEYDSKWDETWYKTIESIPNFRGGLIWSIYPHQDGNRNKLRVIHGDGFDIWYDNQSDDNTKKLLLLTNHFRRMQKLPEVKKLNF